MAHDVFISYSSKDKPTADAVCHALEQAGVRCWIAPRDIQPGADWGGAIIEGISGARVFVLVFSANANTSAQIKREVERAVNRALPIIPFRIENVDPEASLEYFISTPHWLDAFTPPLERHLDYLTGTVKHLLHGEARPEPPPIPKRKTIPRQQLIYIGALAAVVLALLGWQMIPPSHEGSFVSTRIEPTAEAAKTAWAFDPLGGLLTNATAGPTAKVDWRVDDAGFYQMLITGEDRGTLRVEDDELVFTSSAGQVQRVEVEAVPRSQLVNEDPGPEDVGLRLSATSKYPQTWVGKPASAPGALLPARIVGEWRAKQLFNPYFIGSPWTGELTISPAGEYVLKVRRRETGRFEAKDGEWTRSANFGATPMPGVVTDQGAYKWRGRNEVTFKGQAGSFTYRRVGGYRPLEAANAAAS